MYAATQAQGARQAEQEQIIEMMKLFLNIPDIQLLNIIKSDHIQAPKKVNEQPLLSFIIYNALDKKINNRDEWLKLLQLALNTGELKKKNKNNKNAVEKYLKEYVQHNDQHNPNENFSNNNLYDNTRLQAVEKLLTDYYTST
jgi:FtsZ-binding cell division protein ZapB